MDEDERREVALWRYAVLGPLVSARLEHGDRRQLFASAALREHKHPSGRRVRISARTIEAWYYAYLARGLEGLKPSRRKDSGAARALRPELAELLVRAKRRRPRRSVPQLIRIVVRARRAAPGELSRSTVRRVLKRAGICTARPSEHADKVRRAFLPEHAGELWIGDAMHGPRVRDESGGPRRKAYLVSVIDAATRFLVGSEFRLSEGAVDHEAILKHALRVHGRPRTYYVDQGSAYMSGSLKASCADLGIHLLHTQTRDAEAKGAIERWHRTWRAELGVELEGESLTLAELNAVHRAWLAREYHARIHATTGRAPGEHLLAELSAGHLRKLPVNIDLDEVFRHRIKRVVRRDNTIDFFGRRLELVSGGHAGRRVEVRFDPIDRECVHHRPQVWVEGRFVCDAVVLNLYRNARRKRVRLPKADAPAALTPELDPLQDLLDEHYGRSHPTDKKDEDDP